MLRQLSDPAEITLRGTRRETFQLYKTGQLLIPNLRGELTTSKCFFSYRIVTLSLSYLAILSARPIPFNPRNKNRRQAALFNKASLLNATALVGDLLTACLNIVELAKFSEAVASAGLERSTEKLDGFRVEASIEVMFRLRISIVARTAKYASVTPCS